MPRIFPAPRRGMYAIVQSQMPVFDPDGRYLRHDDMYRLEPVGSIRKHGREIRTPDRRLSAEDARALLLRGRRLSGDIIQNAIGFLAPDDPAVAAWPRYEWGDFKRVRLEALGELGPELAAICKARGGAADA